VKNTFRIAATLSLAAVTLAGCMSREDRIAAVIAYEIEACKLAEGDFYEVTTHDGKKHLILTELCHLEPSEVVMNNEWTGTLTTGPLEWTGGEDQASRAMVVTRVAWGDFDRAMRYRSQNNPGVEELRAAEVNFAAAQDTYGDSAWLRVERLKNLLDLRGLDRDADDPSSIGAEARGYFDELIAWADSASQPAAAAEARLAIVDYLSDFAERQRRGIETLGSGDRRLQAAIDHAVEAGDDDEAAEYRQELEERQARRPEAQAEMEGRIASAERELCELRHGLTVTGISEEGLRSRITSALGRVDCDAIRAAAATDDSDGEE
jgi:hypothetical protein